MYRIIMILFGNTINGKTYEALVDAEKAVAELTEISSKNNFDAQYHIERIDD